MLVSVPDAWEFSQVQVLIAIIFASWFVFVAVLDFTFLSIGGHIAKEKAREGLLMLFFAALSFAFGVYFVVPLIALLLVLCIVLFVLTIVRAITLVLRK